MSRFLSVAEVAQINAELIRQFGGAHGLRDLAALQSAVARPQTGYYRDLIEEAAALFESLSQNHPFLDGNKRTAITATGVFLALNGYQLVFGDEETFQWLNNLYETHRLNKSEVESWLRRHAQPIPSV